MFKPIDGGSCVEIPDNAFGFIYKCYLPPIGYGQHVSTGQIAKTEILKRSDVEEEQFWERPTLPLDFVPRRKKERIAQKIDKDHFDPYLEEIRKREWHRRLYGVWFWNNGKLEYITGLNYLYVTYWKFQGKFLEFRIPDMELFYVVQYCMEDNDCLGLNELTKRKNGKTARVGCWSYERLSRLNNHHAGMQSKSDDDAEKAFKKAVIQPWQKLPDFFRPRYDLLKGDDPSELRFFATPRRGEKVNEEDNENEEPLESFFDYESSIEAAYDGPELHTYVADEAGKTKKPVSIKERQSVTRYATEFDGVFHGKHWYTTTVEPEKGEEENYEFQDMTAASNPLDRDENGRTKTGLYTYFLPAQRGMFFDRYGYPDEKKATVFLLNTMRKLQEDNDTRGLSSFKRKNPMNFKSAFSADGEFALYNPELLNEQLDTISWVNNITERGDLEWEGGFIIKKEQVLPSGEKIYVPNKLYWVNNPKGKYERVKGWEPKESNKIYNRGDHFFPNNNHAMRVGCDPFRYDKTKDKRRSNCASFAYQIPDGLFPDEFDDTFVLKYSHREESTRSSNMDILKMAWWCGSQVLFERNVNHWKNDFNDWECAGFLMWMPGEVEPGIGTDARGNTVQTICNYTESYINEHISKVKFKSLIRKETGWLGFKVDDTEKFDEPMAAGITLIAVKGRHFQKENETLNIDNYFRRSKVGA